MHYPLKPRLQFKMRQKKSSVETKYILCIFILKKMHLWLSKKQECFLAGNYTLEIHVKWQKKKRWREINKNIWYFSDSWAFPGGSDGKKREICLQCRRPRDETQLWLLGREDPLQEGMAIHSSILAWRIPWTEEQLTLSLSLIHIVSTNLLLTPDNPGVHTSLRTAGQNTGIKED